MTRQPNPSEHGTPWGTHGPLRVSADGHHLEHRDGTGFVWLGDTAWHLARLAPADIERYLRDRVERGFIVIQCNATLSGRPNHASELPFVGAGPPWASPELHEPYWRHIDFILRTAEDFGLYVALLPWWGQHADCPPALRRFEVDRQFFADPDEQNARYGEALGRRYRDAPNLIWVGSGEYQRPYCRDIITPIPERHLARLARLAEGLRCGDGGAHLLTMHPASFLTSSEDFHGADWLDFNMVQSHVFPDYIDHLIGGDWERTPPKPTVNAEGWYEGEEELYERRTGLRGDTLANPAWVQRYQAYWSVFHGGIGYTYGHALLWRMEDERGQPGVLSGDALAAPGAATLRHLRALLEAGPFARRVPDQTLISTNTRGSDAMPSPNLRCAARADDGSWALAYSTRGEPVRVRMERLADGAAEACWYDPRTGRWRDDEGDHAVARPFARSIPSGAGAPDRYFDPPGQPANGNDWVLYLAVA